MRGIVIPYKGRVKPKKEEPKVNPIKRLPALPASPSAQGKPGRRFGFYIALPILLLGAVAGWGQGNGWHYLAGGCWLGVENLGNNIYAVGQQGLIIHSTDQGTTWHLRESGLTTNIDGVSFPDSLHGWAVADYGYVIRTTDGGYNWQLQTQLTPYWSWKVCFVDTLHGWACGAIDTVYKTIDGGTTWTKYSFHHQNHGTDVIFLDTLQGFMTIDFSSVMKTTDGGLAWVMKTADYQSIDMLDSLKGWACGGGICKTTDGWETQTVQYNNRGWVFSISIGDSLTAWAAGNVHNNAAIIQTTNGGLTWTEDTTLTHDQEFYAIDGHLQPNNVIVVGDGGAILKSTDAGTSWRVIRNVDIGETDLSDVSFWDAEHGWAVGGPGPVYTTNGGTIWKRDTSSIVSGLSGIDAINQYYIWGSKINGRIYETTNGGITWAVKDTLQMWNLYSISFADSLWGIGAGGGFEGPPRNQYPFRIIKTTSDGGITWLRTKTTYVQPLSGSSAIKGGKGWICGGGGAIFHTTDYGLTWQAQNSGITSQALLGVVFLDSLHGWICGTGGTTLWTTDGGNNWQAGNGGTTQELRRCAFADTLNGFAVGTNGTIIQTNDGGRNWVTDTTNIIITALNKVCALDSTHFWAVGGLGMVLGWGEAGNTGIEERGQGAQGPRVQGTTLGQSYPNPTRGIATFDYETAEPEKVRVRVYNVAGQAVRTLVEGLEPAGRHIVIWDGRDEAGRKAGSGTYFYQLEAGERKTTRKMVVIR
jgi:photosystem II stability/assembly factor-like uncharacterized protein